MADTKVFKIYLLILIFFNFFAGGFGLSEEGNRFDVQRFLVISHVREKLGEADNLLADLLKVVLVPFMLIDVLIFMIMVVGTGIAVLPPIVEILLFAPMALFVIFDYVIPTLRGN